jgi:hypothetical protein
MNMASIIYSLCSLLSLGIAWLLWRTYSKTRSRVQYWSALCFSGLTLNNLLLVADKLFFPETDFSVLRLVIALASLSLLLYGLIYEDD